MNCNHSAFSFRKNSVNPSFGKRYVNICSRVERFEQACLQRTLIREYKDSRRRPCQSCSSVFSVPSVVKNILLILLSCQKTMKTLNFVTIRGNSLLKQNLFMQNKPKLCRFWPKNRYFAKKQTQNKPKTNPNKANWSDAKMNVYPLLTVYYAILRLFERNENKPKIYPP